MVTEYDILSGPGKYDLLICFGAIDERDERKDRIPARFTIRPKGESEKIEVGVVLTGLDWEDGSGHSWIFRGHASFGDIEGWFRTDGVRQGDTRGWMKVTN